MSDRIHHINGKSILLHEPYCASNPFDGELVGRDQELRLIHSAWLSRAGRPPYAPLLIGEPGVGKNRIVYELARTFDQELYILQGHEDVTADDLACVARPSDDPKRKIDYILSPLGTAMIRGGICFIDEVGKLRARALAPLASVLDDRRYLDSTLLGERIHAHEKFRFVAATNSSDMVADMLPDFILKRMRPVVRIGPASRQELQTIIAQHYDHAAGDGEVLTRFWDLWRRHKPDALPSPRDAINIFGIAANFAAAEHFPSPGILQVTGSDPNVGVEPRHLEAVFAQMVDELVD